MISLTTAKSTLLCSSPGQNSELLQSTMERRKIMSQRSRPDLPPEASPPSEVASLPSKHSRHNSRAMRVNFWSEEQLSGAMIIRHKFFMHRRTILFSLCPQRYLLDQPILFLRMQMGFRQRLK